MSTESVKARLAGSRLRPAVSLGPDGAEYVDLNALDDATVGDLMLIAHARTDLELAVAVIEAVRGDHQRSAQTLTRDGLTTYTVEMCSCGWAADDEDIGPCPALAALDAWEAAP